MGGRLPRRWLMRGVLALVLIVALAPRGVLASAEIVYGQGLLWRVERPGQPPSHLFGTMHSGDPDITRLPEPVATALDNADSLGLELVISAETRREVRAASRLRGGDLEILLGRARFERVADLGWRYGLGISALLELKPWVVMHVFSMTPAEFARHATPEETPPLDLLLQRRAAARGLVIFGLESPDEQVALFDDLPLADQIAFLDAAIVENARVNWWWTTIKEAYLARDVGAIYRFMLESWMADDPELVQLFRERVIDQRNERMVERMRGRLGKGRAFVAVGALHLPGESGILNLLDQQGYAITRVY